MLMLTLLFYPQTQNFESPQKDWAFILIVALEIVSTDSCKDDILVKNYFHIRIHYNTCSGLSSKTDYILQEYIPLTAGKWIACEAIKASIESQFSMP